MQFTKKSNSQSDSESETSPSVHPSDTDYNESRTTHLEKRLDRVLLDMQVHVSFKGLIKLQQLHDILLCMQSFNALNNLLTGG